ncbi:4a-hydroxytetrahydrobiopterin dehydratase, partial [Streptomyces sp. DT225]
MTSGSDATVRIRPQQFHETAGLEDWRVVGEGACAYWRTGGSFAAGTRFVQAIGELPDLGDDHPDIDVRRDGVTVRLITLTDEYFGMTARHVELARAISEAARTLGLTPDPSFIQTVQVTVDALDG